MNSFATPVSGIPKVLPFTIKFHNALNAIHLYCVVLGPWSAVPDVDTGSYPDPDDSKWEAAFRVLKHREASITNRTPYPSLLQRKNVAQGSFCTCLRDPCTGCT